jgi:hypothetical protein
MADQAPDRQMTYICYDVDVKRTTVFLPDELHQQLRLDAFRSRISMAELIRNRLRDSGGPSGRPSSRKDPILKVAGVCRGAAFSSDIDDALYGE